MNQYDTGQNSLINPFFAKHVIFLLDDLSHQLLACEPISKDFVKYVRTHIFPTFIHRVILLCKSEIRTKDCSIGGMYK